jgi:hypothetical protein
MACVGAVSVACGSVDTKFIEELRDREQMVDKLGALYFCRQRLEALFVLTVWTMLHVNLAESLSTSAGPHYVGFDLG